MKLYVAGPMGGLPQLNYPAFNEAHYCLEKVGYDVSNPAQIDALFPKLCDCSWTNSDPVHKPWCLFVVERDWQWYMRKAIPMVCRVDGIAVLPNWQDSRGARIEVDIAKAIGLPLATVVTWQNRYNKLQQEFGQGTITKGVIT